MTNTILSATDILRVASRPLSQVQLAALQAMAEHGDTWVTVKVCGLPTDLSAEAIVERECWAYRILEHYGLQVPTAPIA